MAPGDLQVSQTAFGTQGQVDWVGFSNTISSASLAVLEKLAASGIQPNTHYGGLAMGSQFRLGDTGLRRIEDALATLPHSSLSDNIFGMKSYARTLAETQSGVNLAALCGCLSTAFSDALSARILAALWDEMGFPLGYKPSISQFISLVRNCAGVCHSTNFDSTIDVMLSGKACRKRKTTRHCSEEWQSRESLSGSENLGEPTCAAAAEEIAAAIKGLFEVSIDQTESIIVSGGNSSAFVAALSYWLFNLRTWVFETDGSVIFTSHADGEEGQILVQYFNGKMPAAEQGVLRVAAKTYFLRPEEPIVEAKVHEGWISRFIIQISWEWCLERTFGTVLTRGLGTVRFDRTVGVLPWTEDMPAYRTE